MRWRDAVSELSQLAGRGGREAKEKEREREREAIE
jgi:hypothetical protein